MKSETKSRVAEDNVVSEYEKQRQEQIRQNQQALAALGLESLVKGDSCCKQKRGRKPGTKNKPVNIIEKKNLPRSTRSFASYDESHIPELNEPRNTHKRENQEQRAHVPKRRRCNNDSACSITYASLPGPFKAQYPLRHSKNESGFYYVHKSSRGWQTQIHVDIGDGHRTLVHHGIYSDKETAALAQCIAKSDDTIARETNAARRVIEDTAIAAAK